MSPNLNERALVAMPYLLALNEFAKAIHQGPGRLVASVDGSCLMCQAFRLNR